MLNDREILARGNDVSFKRVIFDRPASLTDTDYTLLNSTIHLSLWAVPATSNTPDVKLSTGAGLTTVVNTASQQILNITITSAQLATLLDGQSSASVNFAWSIELNGETEKDVPDDSYRGSLRIVDAQALSSIV